MFVLGFRAKRLRQARLADLIHESSNAGEIDSCLVEVHFVEMEGEVSTVLACMNVCRRSRMNSPSLILPLALAGRPSVLDGPCT